MFKNLIASLTLTLLVPVAAFAQEWVEGENYDLIIPPMHTEDSDKIEVTEFFWYGCGHCYNFEPLVTQWKKTLPDDVKAVSSPAVWNKPMEMHARAFYAAQVLGVLDTMHPALFQAMNVDRKRLSSDDEIKAIFVANGVSGDDFDKAYNSFGVSSQARQANARARTAKITGTPEMAVAGKYRISTAKAGGQANMLKVASFLIEKERTERVSKAE
ncbi:MAG: thiol:disulfide interchange protein DsbA/DsbL [Parahaliea sp.]